MRSIQAISFVFFFCLLSGSIIPVIAQVDSLHDPLNQRFEILAEDLETEDPDFTNLTDILIYYRKHPLNLNTANRDDLEELNLLNDMQIGSLIQHRERFGTFISIYELQAIDGFDLATIYMLLPYIRVDDRFDQGHFDGHEALKQGHHEFIMRTQQILEPQLGYQPIDSSELVENPNARYLGSPQHIFARYRFTYSRFISIGVLGEKDAGEEFFRGSQKQGFDFYAGHISVSNIGIVKAAIIGDYQVSFGQGLVIWTGFAFGKTPDAVNIRRSGMGIRPYISTDENRFFRGASSTLRFGKLETTFFGSIKRRDGNTISADTSGQEFLISAISSLQTSGLHSTPNELVDRDALRERIGGTNLTWKSTRFRLGATALYSEYNIDFQRSLSLYNQFEFSARKNFVVGVDYDWIWRNIHFFGEIARSNNGGVAFCNGLTASLDPKLAVSIHQRWFDRSFQNVYGNAFADGSKLTNERGIFIGLVYKPNRQIVINTYIDRVHFPWLRYRIDSPSNGSDFLLQINYTPDKKTDFYFRYRRRNRFINSSDDEPIDIILPTLQDNFRFNAQYSLGKSFRLRSRLEYVRYQLDQQKPENGFILWQELSYKKIQGKLAYSIRYALFETDSYYSRIYGYESDVLYAFSIPAVYNKGSRIYFLINWDIHRNFEIWFRMGRTVYIDQGRSDYRISAGSLNEIAGNTRTDAKIQLRLKF